MAAWTAPNGTSSLQLIVKIARSISRSQLADRSTGGRGRDRARSSCDSRWLSRADKATTLSPCS
eukprot:5545393-Pyramimonas_sp.AAC.1